MLCWMQSSTHLITTYLCHSSVTDSLCDPKGKWNLYQYITQLPVVMDRFILLWWNITCEHTLLLLMQGFYVKVLNRLLSKWIPVPETQFSGVRKQNNHIRSQFVLGIHSDTSPVIIRLTVSCENAASCSKFSSEPSAGTSIGIHVSLISAECLKLHLSSAMTITPQFCVAISTKQKSEIKIICRLICCWFVDQFHVDIIQLIWE